MLLLTCAASVGTSSRVNAAPPRNPYSAPVVIDVNPDPGILETTIVADEATIDLGGVTAHAMAYNGTVPGPEFHLTPGERVIVHFENHLDSEATAIHWHGIELANGSDGSPLTQNQVPPGGTYLYDFIAPRPGLYWYHPHDHASTNQVFKGLYGVIVVADPNEAPLIADGTLPGPASTVTMALSDTTVCKAPGRNDEATYRPNAPWVGEGPLPEQPGPTPAMLCDTPLDEHGMSGDVPLGKGDIPNVQAEDSRTNEGQRVLTNGIGVGGRSGTPTAPGLLSRRAITRAVQPGQGLRLRLVNAATTRYFRLILTDRKGAMIPLVRIGGEGGLLDDAIIEGTQPGGYDFSYESGELLLAPGDRADVVVAVPVGATGTLTLWTRDFQRTGGGDGNEGWTNTPSVPVAHLRVAGAAASPAYSITAGTPLRSKTGHPQEVLGPPTGTLLNPAGFSPAKPGLATPIKLTASGSGPTIDGVEGFHSAAMDYGALPHLGSSRYATLGDTLQLDVKNMTGAHHPFHLHGFSIQPLSYRECPGPVPVFVFPEPEFVDTIDIPRRCTLRYRVRLDDRPMVDGITAGGGLGRWMFHCHIFFHHNLGMMSELVVVAGPTGNERPVVDATLTSVSASEGAPLAMTGTYGDPDGNAVTLSASAGSVVDHGDGTWSWAGTASGPAAPVYITATDTLGSMAQTAFLAAEDNLPPTVMLDPGQVIQITKGSTLDVAASFADQDDDDPYTATIDFGTGTGPQPITPVLTVDLPPQAGTLAGSFKYDKDGTFTVTVTVTDQDGASGSASFQVMVFADELPNTGGGSGLAAPGATLVALGVIALVWSVRRRHPPSRSRAARPAQSGSS